MTQKMLKSAAAGGGIALSEHALRQVDECRSALRHAGCSAAEQQGLPDRIVEVEAALADSAELPLLAWVTDERQLLEERLSVLQQKPKLSAAEVREAATLRLQVNAPVRPPTLDSTMSAAYSSAPIMQSWYRGGRVRAAHWARMEEEQAELAVAAVVEARGRWAQLRTELARAAGIRRCELNRFKFVVSPGNHAESNFNVRRLVGIC